MITKQELETLISAGESDRVERTVSLSRDEKLGEAICAFANDLPKHELPGYLLLGVRDDGSLDGLKVGEHLLQTLLEFRSDGRIVPPPAMSVAKFSFPAGDVAVVEVQPSHQPPVRFKGKICVRVGARKATANEAEERILSEKRSFFSRAFDTWACLESSLADLRLDLFQLSYLPKAIDPETLAANHRLLDEQLASLKFFDLKAQRPTNAGVLLFGKNPRHFLPGAYVQYVAFEGLTEGGEVKREKEFSGDLISLVQALDNFVPYVVVQEKPVPISVLQERKVFNYPYAALREFLMNALMHRDYQSNAPVRFYEFEDRIEISNPGGLFGNARPENFPTENDYRNPTLAEAMKNLGFVNRFSRGVTRARLHLEKNGNLPPVFQLDQPYSFSVSIPKLAI